MPTFGKRSAANLSECHPDLQMVLTKAIQVFDFSVIEGHRGEAEQNRAFHAKKSHLKWPNGKHNSLPSMAADCLPYQPWLDDPAKVWNDVKAFSVMAGIVIAIAEDLYDAGKIQHKITWGGDWNRNFRFDDQRLHDLPHFELFDPTN